MVTFTYCMTLHQYLCIFTPVIILIVTFTFVRDLFRLLLTALILMFEDEINQEILQLQRSLQSKFSIVHRLICILTYQHVSLVRVHDIVVGNHFECNFCFI